MKKCQFDTASVDAAVANLSFNLPTLASNISKIITQYKKIHNLTEFLVENDSEFWFSDTEVVNFLFTFEVDSVEKQLISINEIDLGLAEMLKNFKLFLMLVAGKF